MSQYKIYIAYHAHVNKKTFKQTPNSRTGVDFFHFDFSVHITVTEKINVCYFHLKMYTPMAFVFGSVDFSKPQIVFCTVANFSDKDKAMLFGRATRK